MRRKHGHITSAEHAASILGVTREADQPAVRAAYLQQIQRHPPEADAEAFERVRDAYTVLRDSSRSIRSGLLDIDPGASWSALLDEPRYVGPEPWIEVIRDSVARSLGREASP